jgi:signal recognition particle receptor subunit beta
MASVNPLSRELVFKIVYYGPGLGGKTTTLEHIHATAKPEHRGKLVSLATPVDRTLYFDFLPVRLPPVRGMHVRLQLFTVPGQVYFNATRKLVLTGADGVVFVGDSQIVRADANLESLENLRENLAEQGRDIATMPIVFQHNKRDLPDLLPVEELDSMLNPFGAPSLPTSAKTGEGIYEALEQISARVLDAFKDRLPEMSDGEIESTSFEPIEGGLVMALRDATVRAEPPSDIVIARIGAPPGTAHPSIPPETPTPGTEPPPPPESIPPHAPPPSSSQFEDIPVPLVTARELVIPAEEAELAEEEGQERPSRPPRRGSRPPYTAGLDLLPVRSGDPMVPAESTTAALEAASAEELPAQSLSPAQLVRSEEKPTGVSFAALWPEGEQDTVRDVEDAIARGRYWRAIELCETLVSRVLAGAAGLFGTTDAPRDAAVVPMLLGLDGRRYLGFRSIVREARGDGLITSREALSAYAFAIDCRIARSSIH